VHRPEASQYRPVPQSESAAQTQAPARHTGADPEHTLHPGAVDSVPQCSASEDEHERQTPPEHQAPSPQVSSPVQTHTPAEQTGVVPAHALQPAGDVPVPQREASAGPHPRQAPSDAQYRPAPQSASAVQTHAPALQAGVEPEQIAQPAGADADPQ